MVTRMMRMTFVNDDFWLFWWALNLVAHYKMTTSHNPTQETYHFSAYIPAVPHHPLPIQLTHLLHVHLKLLSRVLSRKRKEEVSIIGCGLYFPISSVWQLASLVPRSRLSFPSLAVWKSGESLVSFLTWAGHNQKMAKIRQTNRLRSTYFQLTARSMLGV